MSIGKKPPPDTGTLPAGEEPREGEQQPNDLEEIIERTGTRYMTYLRTLREEFGRRVVVTEPEQETSEVSLDERARPQEALPAAAGAVASDPPAPVSQSPEAPIPPSSEALRAPIDNISKHFAGSQRHLSPEHEMAVPTQKGIGRRVRDHILLLFAICIIIVLLVVGKIWTASIPAPNRASEVIAVPSVSPDTEQKPTSTSAPERPSPVTVVNGSTAGEQPTALPTPASPTLGSEGAAAATTVVLSSGTPSVATVLQQVTKAEKALRTGELQALVDYGQGSRSLARVRFDLGDAEHAPRLHIITTYESANGSQTSERIIIGDQSWQRQPDGRWASVTEEEGVWGQVQTFLPHAAEISNAEIESGDPTILQWYEVGRDADVTLQIDPATGIPHELRQVGRTTKMILTVLYNGWNTAVEIMPPAES